MELHICDVSKSYSNGVQALKNVTLTIPVGMYGLLGPNGAGKSTLMRILATLQEPDHGSIRLGDIDVVNQKDEVRKTLGYLPQEFGVYPKVSAVELLEHFGLMKGIANRRARREVVEALLLQVNLWEVRKQKLGGYSGGMRQPHPHPPIRRGEPLLRGLDPYLAYRKGPFALYALSEYSGEEQVNGALRRLLEKHRPGEAPLATTLDLYRELQAVTPDSHQYLLHDLFEANTFWELETERAAAVQNETGAWQVTLDVRARKVVVDEAGVETEVLMDDQVEIGVFAPAEEGEELGKLLYVQMHRIRAGAQRITVTVPSRRRSSWLGRAKQLPHSRISVVKHLLFYAGNAVGCRGTAAESRSE